MTEAGNPDQADQADQADQTDQTDQTAQADQTDRATTDPGEAADLSSGASADGAGGHDHAVPTGGGTGPLRLLLLGIVLLLLGMGLRWAQDVAAPYVNVGETDMAGTVRFEASAGTYRIVTSGPNRPPIQRTVCEIRLADGEVVRTVGMEGADGGQERLGVTRLTRFDAPAGTTEVTCGEGRPGGGQGMGRFQVVSAEGPVSLAAVALLAAGGAGLVAAVGWWLLRLRRTPA